jgi:nicotinate-nucleotide adenylyltransferase
MGLIGIFGGTFDPIHHGHLRMAQEVLDATPMEELRLIPCHVPPHRDEPGASASARVKLMEAALAQGDPRLRIDTRELDRSGPSYMVDTLTSLRESLGHEVSLALILGIDAVQGLPQWSRWTQLTALAHLIILGRPGYSPTWPKALEDHLRDRWCRHPAELLQKPQGFALQLPVTQLDISASQIRSLLKQGRSAAYLTPDPVLAEIERLGLYRPD